MENNKECGCYKPEFSHDDNMWFPGHTCEKCVEEAIERIFKNEKEETINYSTPNTKEDDLDDLPF